MPQLLISVRSAAEASDALAGGADWIDVKEPHRGSLGAADASEIAAVIAAVAGRTPVSAALGELLETDLDALAVRIRALPTGLSHVKLGLAGCIHQTDWQNRWRAVKQQLPQHIDLVAVVYADHERAEAPTPHEIIDAAIELGCRWLLIDTFCKDRGGLFDIWPDETLQSFARDVRARGLQLALAGGLKQSSIAQALNLRSDVLAFRGAACGGSRESSISRARVSRLAGTIQKATLVG